jgi:hypothetical protein
MAINTLITIKDALTAFVSGHGQLKAIKFEADDHRAPVITESDSFPLLFVAPIDVQVGRAMNAHTLRIYVYERINDDRSDVLENANDTSLILRDIRVWWNDYGVDDIEIKEDPTGIFVSDRELDNLVGYYADIRFEIPSHGRCSVPVDITPIDPVTCADADYQITDTEDNILYSGTIPSGGSIDQPIQDSTYLVEYENGTPIESGSILAEGSAVIQVPNPTTCADATYTITDDSANVLYSGSIASGGSLNQPIADSTVTITDDSANTLYTVSVNAEGAATQVIADSTAVLKDTANVTISTTSINAEGSADIVAPDATVENSDATYTDTVVSGGTLVLPDITVTDSDGSTFTQPSVENVVCTLSPQDLTLYAPYETADDTISFTIITGSAGTITSADTTGLTSVTYDINGSPATLPFTLAVGDVLTIDFDAAGTGGVVILTGTYA